MLTIQPDPDPDSMFLSIFFIIILVMLSGFFSGTETAFNSVNRTKLKIKAQDGNKAAANALRLCDNYDRLLSAILVGNNLVNITLSVLFNNLFESLIPNPAVCGVVSVAVSTVIVLTFGEISPKMIAKDNAETLTMVFGYPIRVVMVLLYPITLLFSGLKFLLKKLFRSGDDDKITEEELLSMVEEAQEDGSLDMQERELISSAIEFDDAEVKDIFVPRVNVIAVPVDMPMDKIKGLFLEHNFSRMPVYKGEIDSIIGMIHNIDFFAALEAADLEDGYILVARRKRRMVGFCLAVKEPNGKVYIRTLAITEAATRAAFVDYLCRECGVDKVYRRFCLPGSLKESVPYAMARVINVPRFLSAIAVKNPGFQLHIGVDGDLAIPENNGWYIVENGTVRLTDIQPDSIVTPGGLAAMFMAAQPIVMDLLLDE